MKLQSALALLICATNHSYGNAFASNPIAFSRDLTQTLLSSSSSAAATAFLTSNQRGGALTSSSLSSTVNDDVETSFYPDKVAEYISEGNWTLLSARGKQALVNLINGDDGVNAQEHVYKDWPEAGVEDEGKVKLAEQVRICLQRLLMQCVYLR